MRHSPSSRTHGSTRFARIEPFDDAFRARRRAWVEGRLDSRHVDWETPLEAAERFDAAITEHARHAATLVIGTHGMALTAWLVHARGAVAEQEAGAFWAALAFPEVIKVEDEGPLMPRW